MIFYELEFLSSRELLDSVFSLASLALALIGLTVDELDGEASTGVLCSLAIIMRLETLLEISRIPCIEGIISTAEDVDRVGDRS